MLLIEMPGTGQQMLRGAGHFVFHQVRYPRISALIALSRFITSFSPRPK